MTDMTHLSERVAAFCDTTNVPGYVVGVYRAGEQHVVAHGVANLATGAAMRCDTGFLFGSITKVMTTMLVLQQVDRGVVDLDEPVVTDGWITDKLDALEDPEFQAIYLAYDAAFDLPPDDPRLPPLAERARRWYTTRYQRTESAGDVDPAITQLAAARSSS